MVDDRLAYGALFAGVLIMAWAAMGALSPAAAAQVVYAPAVQNGQVVQNAQSRAYFAQQAQAAGSECGDMNDPQNLQHLSHHPEKFSACLKAADPAKLKAATGKTAQQILGG